MPGTYRFTITIDADGNAAVKVLDNVGKAAEDSGDKVEKAGKKTDFFRGMWERAGQKVTDMAVNMLQQIPKVAMETINLGIQADAMRDRFERFAGGTELASGYLEAMQRASYGTVDSFGAMQSATKLLQMGLVGNADEMEALSAIAIRLGDQTAGATDRVNDFALMLANQSIPRLDNFGISSGRVRNRIEELQKSIAGMTREEAFKIAVIEEGSKSLAVLGDQSGSTANKIAILQAAVKDAQIGLGELAVGLIDSVGGVDKLATRIRDLPGTVSTLGMMTAAWAEAVGVARGNIFKANEALDAYHAAMVRQVAASVDWKVATEEVRYAHYNAESALDDAADAAADLTGEVEPLSYEMRQYLADLAEYESVGDDAVYTTDNFAKAMENLAAKQEIARQATRKFTFDASMAFTDLYRRADEQARDYTQTREEIEAEHQANLAELQKRGQATRIQVDVEAEQAKLAELQKKLNYALMEEADFTDKTKEITRLRKQDQIAELQSQIGSQEQLLDDYYNGRLWRQGENVSAELATETARYEEEKRLAAEAHLAQIEEQRQALGQMVLQQFDAWVQMSGISSEKAMEMRLAIAAEYGLIDEAARTSATVWVSQWEAFAASSTLSADEVIRNAERTINAINAVPSEKTITFRYQTIGSPPEGESHPEFVPHTPSGDTYYGGVTPGMQHGGSFVVPPGHPRDSFLMGVSSGERVIVQTRQQQGIFGGGGAGGGSIVNNIQVTVSGDVWSDQKVRDIADRIELLLPKSGVRSYTGAYAR